MLVAVPIYLLSPLVLPPTIVTLLLVCVVLHSCDGLLLFLFSGATDPKTLNPKLICPFFDVFFPFLPEKIRKPLRFGVRHGEV